MTGYELYQLVRKRHPHLEERLLSDNDLVEIIGNCKESFRANCGELRRLSFPIVIDAIIKFVKRGGLFETTCGRLIYGKDGLNPLIKALHEQGLLGNGAHICYSFETPLNQVMFGATHVFIADDGVQLFVEEPHGCIENIDYATKRKGILIDNDQDLAQVIEGFVWSWDFVEVFSVDDDSAKANTLNDGDVRWNEDAFCSFETEDEFGECISKRAELAFVEGD